MKYEDFTLDQLNLMYRCADPSTMRDEIGKQIDLRMNDKKTLKKEAAVDFVKGVLNGDFEIAFAASAQAKQLRD